MPRKALILSDSFPYHITNRSNNRDCFYVELPTLWKIFLECLAQISLQFKCEVHAFVLMSNHYHLILSTPEANVGEAMKYLHREVARKANRASGRINHFFGGRYKWSLIGTELYYWNAVKYVFRNPVKAGICGSVREYPHSSLNDSSNWKMIDPFYQSAGAIELDLDWLEEAFRAEQETGIQSALRRRVFALRRTSGAKSTILDAMPFKKGTVTY